MADLGKTVDESARTDQTIDDSTVPAGGVPDSRATIFCDGSADESFRRGVDVELSHWIPNRTPGEFRAGLAQA